MSTEIYYFSGTGNSLALARDIAEKLGGKLISIASVMEEKNVKIDADVIGFVFPTYYEPYGGVPLIVRRFVRKLDHIESSYIFAICTYGSGSFKALNCLEKIIGSRGGRLAAGFKVNMPNNMAGPSINNPQKQEKMFEVWNKNINVIISHINARNEGRFNTPNVLVGKAYGLIEFIVSPLIFLFKPLTLNHLKRYSDSSGSYEELLPFMDRSFYTSDKCTECANCKKICQVNNIKMVNERPLWLHHCEFCLACFHWCPQEAIESKELKGTIRYHHPDVKPSDMQL
jgi:flavodoxin/Pyruvate/2-oxoacid:ferredoxin oxidoreductase delta subunit